MATNDSRDSNSDAKANAAKQRALSVPKAYLSEKRGGRVYGHRGPGSSRGRGLLGENRHKSGREKLLDSGVCSGGGEVEAEKSGHKNLKTSASWREYGLREKRGAILRKLLIARFCSWWVKCKTKSKSSTGRGGEKRETETRERL